ncbi:MAG: hypothetical protein U7126_21385 [Microcoleus sp.]
MLGVKIWGPRGVGVGVGVGMGMGMGLGMGMANLERIVLPGVPATFSMNPVPGTLPVVEAKKSRISMSLARLTSPSLLRSTTKLVPLRPIPTEPGVRDVTKVVSVRTRLSVPAPP